MCTVAQSCLILCDPVDCSLPGSSVHGIISARILGRIAISYSRGSSQLRDQPHVSCISRVSCIGRWIFTIPGKPRLWPLAAFMLSHFSWFCETLWTVACRLLHPWDSLGKNAGVACHALFQRYFLTQGGNPCLSCLLHWQTGSLPLVPLYH